MVALDTSTDPLSGKAFRGAWNALNLITTLGDLSDLDKREKVFMMVTMVAFLIVGGYAVSSLTGVLSSDAVMEYRERKKMERKLDNLGNPVIVIGFGMLGRLVAGRLHDAGEQVVVIDSSNDLATCGPPVSVILSSKVMPGWTMRRSTTRGSSGPRRLW